MVEDQGSTDRETPFRQLLASLVHEALAKPDSEREAFVEETCTQNPAIAEGLREELAKARTETLTEEAPAPSGLPIQRIGPYRLLERIGEGGMGSVYVAQQDAPVRRTVALKVVKTGLDSEEVLARFQAEHHALALMNHPNIARVYDAGATEQGLPYFVMEHVQGVSLTEYCDQSKMRMADRLRLFTLICHAVQHAHQKGIIHRDLKPSNILIMLQDGVPVPKIIDFGIAKATHQKLSEKTLHTELGRIIGTPSYMSPEQAGTTGLDIDTRSDVYSLGVVLYELLTGLLPFDPDSLRQAGLAEIQRIIREEEPAKPSTRLSSIGDDSTAFAKSRGTDTRALTRRLRGDLDWIILKCLEKDRTRRYDSAAELAEDIRRHLEHEPVTAGPPSQAYRLKKILVRHRWFVATTLFVFASLASGLGIALWALDKEAAARKETENTREREKARAEELKQVVEFQSSRFKGTDIPGMAVRLRKNLFANAVGLVSPEQELTAEQQDLWEQLRLATAKVDYSHLASDLLEKDLLEPAFEAIRREFKDSPTIQAKLLHELGTTATLMGLWNFAEESLQIAFEIRSKEHGLDHRDSLDSKAMLGHVYQLQGKFDQAFPLLEESVAGQRRLLGDDDELTLSTMYKLGNMLAWMSRHEESEELFKEALELSRKTGQPVALLLNGLGEVKFNQRRFNEAIPLLEQSIEALDRESKDDIRRAGFVSNLGISLYEVGRKAEAEPMIREAFELRKEALGEANPATIVSLGNLSLFLYWEGRIDESIETYKRAIDLATESMSSAHPDRLTMVSNLGSILTDIGRLDEAEPYLLESLAMRKIALGEDHFDTLITMNHLAALRFRQERWAEMAKTYGETIRLITRTDDPYLDIKLIAMNDRCFALRVLHRYEEAEQLARESVELCRTAEASSLRLAKSLLCQGRALTDLERPEEALSALGEALAATKGTSQGPSLMHGVWEALANCHAALGNEEKAAEWRAKLPEDHGKKSRLAHDHDGDGKPDH